MPANHNDTITIDVSLDGAPLVATGFEGVMLLVDLATNSLDGDRVRSYTTAAEGAADLTSGFISASTNAAIQVAFAQRPQPSIFKVGYIDLVGGETYATGLAAVVAYDPAFYGVCINVRTDAEVLLVAAAVEAMKRIFMFQSADADWWTTGGPPAALTALTGLERSIGIFHDTATEWADVGWMVDRLNYDPDVQSAPWNAAPNSVAAYTTQPTQAEKDFADTNRISLGLVFGAETFWIDAAHTMAGRGAYEIVTADWFAIRLQELITTQKIAYALRGEKIIVGEPGKNLIEGLIDQQFDLGVKAKHFVAGETESTMADITDADRAAERLRGSGRAQLAIDARIFNLAFNFGRNPLNAN